MRRALRGGGRDRRRSELRAAFLLSVALATVGAMPLAAAVPADPNPGDPKPGDPVQLGFDPDRLDRIEQWLDAEIEAGRLVGAVTAVARRGRLVQLAVAGELDRARDTPMREDAIFRIASMTKMLTAVAALSLYEEGAFLLDEPASRFLPELAELEVGVFDEEGELLATRPAEQPIRILDLLRHTSGLAYASPPGLRSLYRIQRLRSGELTSAEVVGRLAQLPLAEDPGTRWRYGLSTDVLGRLLEVVTGQPLDEILRERVFEPLDLRDTGFVVSADDVARLPSIERFTESGGWQLAEAAAESPLLSPPVAVSGGGGWGATGSLGGAVSTARDLLRFLEALSAGGELDGARVLAPSTVAMMTRDQLEGLDGPGPGYGYGLGVGVLRDPSLSHEPFPAGTWFWAGSENTYAWVDPEHELVGVFLTQVSPFGHARLMDRFQHLVYQALVGGVVEDSP